FLFSLPVAVLGLFLVVGTNWNDLTYNYKTGIYFALLAALCYAGFLISLRKIQHNQPSFFYTLMLISFVTTCCFALKMTIYGDPFTIPDTYNLTILLSLAFFSQVLGWLLIANAMPRIRTSLTGFILLLQPALSFIWDVLFFSRPTDLINWMGVIITLTAIYMGVTGNIKKL
ncbi:MAG: EamA family transporter, partial [Desulfobulbaceae bacterium]|nr:EamA family transporter [Desulfobulbaceae bacterium]